MSCDGNVSTIFLKTSNIDLSIECVIFKAIVKAGLFSTEMDEKLLAFAYSASNYQQELIEAENYH